MSIKELDHEQLGSVTATIDNETKSIPINIIKKYSVSIVLETEQSHVFGNSFDIKAKFYWHKNDEDPIYDDEHKINYGQAIVYLDNEEMGYVNVENGAISKTINNSIKYEKGRDIPYKIKYLANKYYQEKEISSSLQVNKFDLKITPISYVYKNTVHQINNIILNDLDEYEYIITKKPLDNISINFKVEAIHELRLTNLPVVSNEVISFTFNNVRHDVRVVDGLCTLDLSIPDIGDERTIQAKKEYIYVSFEETQKYNKINKKDTRFFYYMNDISSLRLDINPLQTSISIEPPVKVQYNRLTYFHSVVKDEYGRNVKFGELKFNIDKDDNELLILDALELKNGYAYPSIVLENKKENEDFLDEIPEYPLQLTTKLLLNHETDGNTLSTDIEHDTGVSVQYEAQVFVIDGDNRYPVIGGTVVFYLNNKLTATADVDDNGVCYVSDILVTEGTHHLSAKYRPIFNYTSCQSEADEIIIIERE